MIELDEWDKQIIADYKGGKLTVLMEEAIADQETFKCEDMEQLFEELGI
jgi:hypothetical protein